MRVLGLIPARGGSERLPGKNLAEIGGRTLVRIALETAAASERLDAVALSSDDEAILAEAEGLPGVVRVRRPPELATAAALAFDVAVHALAELEPEGAERFDALALIQCTSPLTAAEDIDGTIALVERTGAGSAVSVTRVPSDVNPYAMKRLGDDGRLLPLLGEHGERPARELPAVYVRNGSVYVSRRATIEGGTLLSGDVRGHVMPRERSLDINVAFDLTLARLLADRSG
jgi:CMP-N,N'-diacetyllegionaminic acid synthase